MKRIWTMLLAVLMLVSALPLGAFSVVVGADSTTAADAGYVAFDDTPTVWADRVGGYAGETVTVAVRMQGNPGLVGWQFKVDYDEAILELTDQTRGDAFAGGSLSFGPKKSPANAMWYDFLNPDVMDNGVLYYLTFRIAENAAVGTYTLEVYSEPGNIANANMESVEFQTVSGAVEVYERVSGVALDAAELDLKNGESGKLNPIFTPATAYNKNVSWSSSNTEVATVSEDGTVTAIKRGKAVITVTTEDGGYQAEAVVNVTCATLIHCKAVAPDHYNKGNIEYWHCANCGGYFVDAAGIKEISYADVELAVIPHEYSDSWTYNEELHWNECSCGAKINEQEHAFDNACDAQCDCGYTREVPPHVYDGLTDGYCNECGAEREVTEFVLTPPFTRVYALNTGLLDVNGGYVDVAYADGASGRVTLTEAMITGFDAAVAGVQTLTVTVGSGSATYDVLVTEDPLPTIRVDVAQKAYVGKTVVATVYVENNPGLISMKLSIDYDDTKFELVEAQAGEGFAVECGPLGAPLTVNYVDGLNPDNTTNGVFVVLTFKVKDDAVEGPTPITVRYDADDLFDYDLEPVLFNVVNGETEICKCLPGDVNGDGNVNIFDLGMLQRHLNGWDVTIELAAANVNGDATVNIFDLGILQRYLNGWDVELK